MDNDAVSNTHVINLARLHFEGKDEDFLVYAHRVARRMSEPNRTAMLKVIPPLNASPLRLDTTPGFARPRRPLTNGEAI